MNVVWAFVRNRRKLDIDDSLSLKLPPKDTLTDKGKRHKLRNEAESTNAMDSFGLSHSSEETSVIEVERRV
jgi:hypothetical protein